MNILLKINSSFLSEPIERPLSEGVYRIGRSELCDIVLEGKEVSRSHLELRVTSSTVYVTNMSTSGILKVNAERVETAELKEMDQVQIGSYEMFYVFQSTEELNQSLPPEIAESSPNQVPDFPVGEELQPNPVLSAQSLDNELREFPLKREEEPAFGGEIQGALALKVENTDFEDQAIVAKIVFTEGPLSGTEIPIQGYEMTMGRSRKADIYIPDEKLSRKHVKITRMGMGYRLIDLESRNGTYVNGVRVLEHPLSSFDVIEIGKSKIRFLILDMDLGGIEKGGALKVIEGGAQTKSLQLVVEPVAAQVRQEPSPSVYQTPPTAPFPSGSHNKEKKKQSPQRNIILGSLLILLLGVYFMIPSKSLDSPSEEKSEKQDSVASPSQKENQGSGDLLPAVPREFSDLSPENQRKVEGHYNTALRYQEREDFSNALKELQSLHFILPYYKESKRFEKFFENKVLERQRVDAAERAKRDRDAEIRIYLEEGVEYLGQSNFSRAGEAFRNVLLLDPQNDTAAKGVRAAELQITDLSQLPPEVDPDLEKRRLVSQLLEKSQAKFEEKSYQEAINFAEQVRAIEIPGETEYLNAAKQIIDRSRIQQKEEFEPFLIQAKEKFAEGDYNLSRDLCDEMLKRDPSYEAAQECSIRARKQLNRLAKEAYTHGYILESMNRIEEAKQYWNRAKNYARPGDPYYDKIQRKLDNYQ